MSGLEKVKYVDLDYKLGGKASLLLQFSEPNKSVFFFALPYLLLILYSYVVVKPSHPKTEFPCRVIINLSSQNFVPFLVPPLFPSGWRCIKEKG